MRAYPLVLAITIATAGMPARTNAQIPDYLTASLDAVRDLTQQVGVLQQTFATIPGPPQGRGLYNQADKIRMDLANLEVLLARKVKRDAVYTAYAQADTKLNRLLDDIEGIKTWDPAVRMAARRVRASQQQLNFVLSGGDTAPTRQAQLVHEQTLLLVTRAEDLEGLIRFNFDKPTQDTWNTELGAFRRAVAALQRAEQDKATPEQVRKQFAQTEKAWSNLVVRYRALPEGRFPFVRHSFAQADRVLGRLATLLDVEGRRTPLNDSPAR